MSSTYDPFLRGPHPVGAKTETWTDEARGRSLPVEIWYPATADHAGADLDPATQDTFAAVWTTADMEETPMVHQAAVRDATPAALPGQLVLFSHGFAGHRREATYLCTHLASHGYVVVSADFIGSCSWDIDAVMASDEPDDIVARREFMGLDRKADVPFLAAEATRRGWASDGPIGFTGISLGGWTAYIAPAVEPRVTVTVPMCPAGGRSPIYPDSNNALRSLLDFNWHGHVDVLHCAADRDSWLPLYGHLELFRQAPSGGQIAILLDGDHNHFCDNIAVGHAWFYDITMSMHAKYGSGEADWQAIANNIPPLEDLVDEHAVYALWRGLAVARMDATLRRSADAADLLTNRLREEAARVGAPVLTINR